MLPGERATVQVTAEKAGYAEAQKIDQVHPPTGAVQAPCPHMDACGGCQLQQVSYKTQLQLKHKLVVDTLQRIGKFDLHHVPHVLGSPAQQWEYRNNMQFAWDAAGQRLGLRPPGGHAEVWVCIWWCAWVVRTSWQSIMAYINCIVHGETSA